MNNTDFDTQLTQQIEALKKEKQPERDLWAGIELALVNESAPHAIARPVASKRVVRFGALAAGLAFVGMLTWFGMQQHPNAINSEALVAAMSEQHQQQKQSLLVKFKDQPALTQNWQEQLQELDDAAAAIKVALEHEPNNLALLKMLQNVHQQQIDLIERVHSPKWLQI